MGTVLKLIKGLLGYAQAHLTVHKTGSLGGIGVDLQHVNTAIVNDSKPIWQNQFSKMDNSLSNGELVNDTRGFMLVTSNIPQTDAILIPTQIDNKPVNLKTDVQTKTFPP